MRDSLVMSRHVEFWIIVGARHRSCGLRGTLHAVNDRIQCRHKHLVRKLAKHVRNYVVMSRRAELWSSLKSKVT